MNESLDFERRFGGVRRLYGDVALQRFRLAHVAVIGIGGVGSWAVEALARNAIGSLTLADLDHIAESNVNRQLHAVETNFGKAKVSAMHERILGINPECNVIEIEDFITQDNVASLLSAELSGIVDCIDDAKAKAALAAYCKAQKVPLIMTGAAGGRLDPTKIKVADLAKVTGDKLLSKVRNILRAEYGYPKGGKANFGVQCLFSDEAVIKPEISSENICETDSGITGLNCAGYGSSVCVTASFGFSASALLLNQLRESFKS